MLQVSPFTQLDLANYACQDVNVSFAVANAAGLSNFSSPTPITVPGGTDKYSYNREMDTYMH